MSTQKSSRRRPSGGHPAAGAAALKEREAGVFQELSSRFNELLAALQAPDAAHKVTASFERKGRLSTRRKAGTGY